MSIQNFAVYDAARSNVVAFAAYFPLTNTIVVEELADCPTTTIGFLHESDNGHIRILALEKNASVIGALHSAYQTKYVFKVS